MKTKVFLLFLLFISSVSAEEAEVTAVFRNITMSNEEAAFKDYYIKIDSSHPIKKNLVVKAVRKIDVKDSAGKPVGDFKTQVGLLKFIHIDSKIAVAREFQLTPRDSLPALEQIGIMVGDQIDFTESFVDNSSKKIAPKNANHSPQEPQRDISSAKPVENSQPTEPDKETTSTEQVNPANVVTTNPEKI